MLFCYFPSLSLEACYVDIAIFLVCLRRRAIFAIIACYFTIFLVCFRRRAILLTIAIFFVLGGVLFWHYYMLFRYFPSSS